MPHEVGRDCVELARRPAGLGGRSFQQTRRDHRSSLTRPGLREIRKYLVGILSVPAEDSSFLRESLVTFPAAMSQYALFDVDPPFCFSMGAFRQIGGHELTHGYDSDGGHYDQDRAHKDW